MESLALLCTLHADGPTSLRRLRRAGCDSLDLLERMAPQELAELLDVPPAVARRLGREARGLTSRLDPVLDDREEAPELGTPAGMSPAPTSGGLDRRDRALLKQVIGRWDKAESSAPREVPPLVMDEPAEEPEAPEPRAEADPILVETVELRPEPPMEVEQATPAVEQPAVCEPAPALRGGEVDGLDACLASALASAGISDLQGLVDADASRLARELKVPFAGLRRVQFLAARSLPKEPEAAVQEPAPPEPAAIPAAPEAALASEAPASSSKPETAPRKFWEPLPRWAENMEASEVEQPIPLPPEEPTPPATPRATRPRPGRALNWTFESSVPAQAGPAEEQQPRPLSSEATIPPPGLDDEGTAGPFA